MKHARATFWPIPDLTRGTPDMCSVTRSAALEQTLELAGNPAEAKTQVGTGLQMTTLCRYFHPRAWLILIYFMNGEEKKSSSFFFLHLLELLIVAVVIVAVVVVVL